jgi:hypothetical protein
MDRARWLITLLWLFVIGVGATALALETSGGDGDAWIVVGVLLGLAWTGFVWRKGYRWAQQDQEPWRRRFGEKPR